MKESTKANDGQIVLITLLVLAIATTVALSLISRTTNDASITRDVEESSRAFSAAEAGIEEALQSASGTNGAVTLAAGVTYSVNVSTMSGALGLYELPKKTLQGNTETIWLVNHDQSTGSIIETPTYTAPSISVCWSKKSSTEVPALIATLLYKKSGVYKTVKTVYDPDSVSRSPSNNFSGSFTAGGCGGTTGTDYKATITFSSLNLSEPIVPTTDTLIALRLRPAYYDTKLFVDAGAEVLPAQGYVIESTGTTVGGTNRKIIVYQQYRSPSTIFDAALYSEGALRK